MGIIYEIRNLVNDKPYVGRTTNNFKVRYLWNHKPKLEKGNHYNKHLQRAWNKYGEENFEFNIIVEINDSYIVKAEQYWIDKLQAYKNGYNQEKYANELKKPNMTKENNPMWSGGKDEFKCENCEEVYLDYNHKLRNQRFCSVKCRSEAISGEDHKQFKDKIVEECNFCGDEYKRHKCRSTRKYCSQSCASKDRVSGSGNPSWKGGKVELECESCGSKFKVKPYREDSAKYCSKRCNSSNASISKEEAKQIKKLLKETDFTYKEIANKTKTSIAIVGQIKRNETWVEVKL